MTPQIETKTSREIKLFQEERMREQLAYVSRHSAYYQNLFKRHLINISTIKTLEDLRQIPVTTKTDLQRENKNFFCVSDEQIVDYARTSGTTGKPIIFGLTDKDLERLAYNEAISFACTGMTKNDRVQLMTTMDRQFMAGLAYFLGLRKLGASVIRTGSGIPALQWESIINNKPTYLIGVPSFLLKLIYYAENNGINLKSTSVKAAICIGESLRNPDLSPSILAQRINEKWPIKLYSTYASTEMSTAFTECQNQQGGHGHPELIITEVLDENNAPVQPGEIGELTVTTLGVEALPLVRFKTGDLVKLYKNPCTCGRNTPRIGPVLGRAKQMVKYKGTTIYPPAIQNAINYFEDIKAHLIILTKDKTGQDKINIKLVTDNHSDEFIKTLKEHFQAQLRVIPQMEFIDNAAFNKIIISENNRKPKFVIDKR